MRITAITHLAQTSEKHGIVGGAKFLLLPRHSPESWRSELLQWNRAPKSRADQYDFCSASSLVLRGEKPHALAVLTIRRT